MFIKHPGKLQGIGKIQYPSRVIGMGLAALIYGVNQAQMGPLDSTRDIIMIVAALVYPHLALFIYWKSGSARKVETYMLLIDALFSGIALPFMGFNLLPSLTMASFTSAGTMVAKGVSHFFKGLLAIAFGIFVGLSILSFDVVFQYHNEYNLILAVCLFILVYATLFSYSANQFVIRIVKHKRLIASQQELIKEQHKDILDSINYAQRIQSAILPNHENWKKALPDSFVLYLPKDVVAGDFYWLHQSGDSFLIAAADCTGHGVPGAMVSVVCNNALNRAIREFELIQPGEILTKVSELVVEELSSSDKNVKDGMDIALCRINPPNENGNVEIEYAGAHNPLWLIKKHAESLEEIKANKQPIGLFDKTVEFTNHKLSLSPGDQFYIFSDGFCDQFGGEANKKYKSKKFKEFLLEHKTLPMNSQKTLIEEEFNKWKGELEQLDDICIIGVRI